MDFIAWITGLHVVYDFVELYFGRSNLIEKVLPQLDCLYHTIFLTDDNIGITNWPLWLQPPRLLFYVWLWSSAIILN